MMSIGDADVGSAVDEAVEKVIINAAISRGGGCDNVVLLLFRQSSRCS